MLSDLAIRRPVFAIVINLLLVVLGLAAYERLAVREYPKIDPPIVSVSASYTGAAAPVVESQITEVIEQSIAGLEGIKRISASSREERASVSIEFSLSRDIDAAANDVRDRVARISSLLPDGADTPRVAKVDSDASAMMYISLLSDRRSALELNDYAERFIVDRLSTVPGVASVSIGGQRRYAMRVWLDRGAMAARGLTVADIETALRRGNVEMPSGRIESSQREFSVRTDSRLRSVEDFKSLVVRETDGYQARLGEVARVELAAANVRGESRTNGKQTIGLGVVRQSTANALSVADGVNAEMAKLRTSTPEDIEFVTGYDESVFVRESINQVFEALAVAMMLVVAVIFVFLRSARATLIPALAIPVSIIASLIVMAVMGFSINVITLLALVLAIGLVVDDAIVVLENIHRRIEEGEPPLLASQRGARQITFAVISTTMVLIAVFIPLSYLEGSTGRLFTEFGIALASAVTFSALVALTLTPMLCSKLLRPVAAEGRFYRVTQRGFDGLARGFGWTLGRALAMPLVVIALAIAVSALAVQLWTTLPKEFAPSEDRGVIFVSITAPEGSSLAYTLRQVTLVEDKLKPVLDEGAARTVYTIVAPGFGGGSPVNRGFVMMRLKPWRERDVSQQELVKRINPTLLAIPGVRAIAINPGSLGQGGSRENMQLVLAGTDYDTIKGWTQKIIARVEKENRNLVNLDTDYQESKPELKIAIDRRKAADLGISFDDIGRTLEVMLGSRIVTRFPDRGQEYDVIVQARPQDRAQPSDLTNIFVRPGVGGALVPLTNLVSITEVASPLALQRLDRMPAITVSASLASDYPLGEAIDYMTKVAHEEAPEARISYSGASRAFREASGSLVFTFALACLIVFLVLAAQFESFVHPFIIMLSVPLAVTGGLLGLTFTGVSLNIYSQIGMILLVGLMAKNGILVVEFANQLRIAGMGVREAVRQASIVRLRPILMTSISTVFGALPLAVSSGAGWESRQALAMVVISGIAISTVLTLFVIPVFYSLLAPFTRPANSIAMRITALERTQPAAGE